MKIMKNAINLIINNNPSDKNLAEELRKCVQDVTDKTIKRKLLGKLFLKGHLLQKISALRSELNNSGLDEIDVTNPLHLLAALHPERNIRIAALKLARKLDINITQVCNFGCEYCYQQSRDDQWMLRAETESTAALSLDELKKVIRESVELGTKKVKFTGGEPFASPIFLDALEYAFTFQELQEIEIVSNLSLVKNKRHDKLKDIVGSGKRLHIHVSIDGFQADAPKNTKNKIYNESGFIQLKKLLVDDFPEAEISVNTMWTERFIPEESFTRLYDFMETVKPNMWSISLPYLVKDIIEKVKENPNFVPPFEHITNIANQIISKHTSKGKPFPISIPLMYHDNDSKWSLTYDNNENSLINHPCLPCNGSYFIIGPNGSVFDCLLLSKSNFSCRRGSLLDAIISVGIENQWYEITIQSSMSECMGCRYEKICRGQCANDKYNSNHGKLGRDKSACSMLVLAETGIWQKIDNEGNAFQGLLNEDGFIPDKYDSVHQIINCEFGGLKHPISAIFHNEVHS